MLASVAEERTSRPEGAYPPSAATPAPREHEADKKSSKAGPVISAILLLALLAGGAAWAYTEGVFDRFTGGGTPTTPRPTMSATTPTPEEEADTEDPVTETTTERERTTITEPRNPGTLRFEESEADNAPAPAEPSAEPPAPGTSAPEQPSAATPTQQGGAPAGEPSIGNQPEVTNSPAPAVELPNLDSLLGGGR